MFMLAMAFAVVSISIVFFILIRECNTVLTKYELHFKGQTKRVLTDLFVFWDPVQIWTLSLSLSVSCMLVVGLLTYNIVITTAVGVALLLSPPIFFAYLKKKRTKRFNEQLPLMLSSLASALKAGAGVQIALKTVVDESPSPLSEEFGLVLREQRLGMSFNDALDNLLVRMPTEATQLVVSSLKIASQTGGNLAQALERVATTLRSIKQIEDKIEALTSQGRFQAKVMIFLPIVLMFALNFGDFQLLELLWTTKGGALVLGVIVFLEGCGIYFIQKIVKIDV